MIILMARVKVRPERMLEATALSQQHATLSRSESGCVSHAVYKDSEYENQLVFVQEWESEQSVATHLALPSSAQFVDALLNLSVGKPSFSLYVATELPFPRLGAA
jgi:quinol monooxygenase YgiN